MDDDICEICGERNVLDAQFCTSCGAYLGWDGARTVSAGSASPPPSATSPLRAAPTATPVHPAPSGLDARPANDSRFAPAAATSPAYPESPAFPAPPSVDPTPSSALTAYPPVSAAAPLAAAPLAAAPLAAAPGTCPRCGTANEPGRRFCGKCAYALSAPPAASASVGAQSTEPTAGGRGFGRLNLDRLDGDKLGREALRMNSLARGGVDGLMRTGTMMTERAARSAYRHSLPMRFRVLRWGGGILVAAVVAAAFGLTGGNPVRWAKHRLDDLRGSVVAVSSLTVSADPATSVAKGYTAGGVVDNRLDTAWATSLNSAGSTDPSCAAEPAKVALLVTAPAPKKIQAIAVRGGLAADDPDRPLQWRPRMLELRSADGWCERIQLADTADRQQVSLKHPPTTSSLRVSVVGAYAPQGGNEKVVAITEIGLLTRPR